MLRFRLALGVALAALALPGSALALTYRFDFRFGGAGSAPGQFSQPAAVAIDPVNGDVFVADTINDRVQALTPTGTPRPWAAPATPLSRPGGIGVSPVGSRDVYVSDTNNNRVVRYDQQGNQLGVITLNGLGSGNLQLPRGIDFDSAGNVYVTDAGTSHRINVYSPAGTPQRALGGGGTFQFLSDVAVGPDGSIYAADQNRDAIQRFTADGTPAERWGALGSGNGQFQGPGEVTTDADGNVLVSDSGNHRVQVFDARGTYLTQFGTLGADPGEFQDPQGIAVSPIGNRDAYVTDGNNCCAFVSAFTPLPDPVLGKSMDIQVDKGTVLYKPPGARRFTRLTRVTLVQSGTVIDARRGTVSITSATASGALQSADFYSGVFRAIQKRQGRGLTDAVLIGGSFKRCPAGLRAAKAPKPVRKLWGSGAGQFRTRGRYAAASIRGTTWLTEDRCDGTLIRVTEGAVTVRDLVRKRTVVVTSGRRYLARGTRRPGR